MEKKDLTGQDLSKKLTLEINFKGDEFNGFVNITTLNQKLISIDKTIKNIIGSLKKSRKIKVQKEVIESIQVDIKRNSLDNIILVNFIAPLCATIIGGLFVNYMSYLATKKIPKGMEIEVKELNNNLSNLNQILKLTQIKDIHSKVEIKYNNNNFLISNPEDLAIKQHVKELKDNLAYEEYEDEFIGRIEKLDKSKDQYHLTIDNSDKKIPINFDSYLEEEEVRELIFHKLRVKGVVKEYKGKILNFNIFDYKIIRRKRINDYNF